MGIHGSIDNWPGQKAPSKSINHRLRANRAPARPKPSFMRRSRSKIEANDDLHPSGSIHGSPRPPDLQSGPWASQQPDTDSQPVGRDRSPQGGLFRAANNFETSRIYIPCCAYENNLKPDKQWTRLMSLLLQPHFKMKGQGWLTTLSKLLLNPP